jgi:hypothetical protein
VAAEKLRIVAPKRAVAAMVLSVVPAAKVPTVTTTGSKTSKRRNASTMTRWVRGRSRPASGYR